MATTRWLRWIGLGLLGAGVGYVRARARRPEEPLEPIDLPVGGVMAMNAGITPDEGIPHGYASRSRIP